ncbi:MAG: alpha/beta fold hydrolase [Burkholderiaceae bacterium]|nr:alpha/beta fold hydrolase [Roseateles sp.]MBV8468867.1 alpha/beta fold hydrolase [Burkholderiaceae bacterium]
MLKRTPEWFEAQYDNLARVSNSAHLLGRWAEASALVRRSAPCILDIPYAGPGSDASECLDIFPSTASKAPVLVFIHGAYWRAFDKSDHSFVAAVYAQAGAMVVIPNYGHCPAVNVEQISMQMAQVLAWVWRNIADFGGDPNRIYVVGHSAGGTLAAMLSCCEWKSLGADLPRQLVKGALSISGLHDLKPLLNVASVQADLQLTPAAAKRLSPIHYPAPAAPHYAVVGADESDEFHRQTQVLRSQWGERAVPVCATLSGLNHFNILHDFVDPEGRLYQLTRQLLDLRWYSPLL